MTARNLRLVKLLCAVLLISQIPPAAAQSPGGAPTAPPPVASSLDSPITREQLQTYFDSSLLLEASKQHIQDGIQHSRASFPPWFPEPVWQDIKKQVAEIDLVSLLLPLYQRIFTERDGEAIALLYQGPTGHAYAQAALDARLEAIHSGLEGSAAEAAAMKSDKEAQAQALQRKRLSELTTDQLQALHAVGNRQTMADGLKLDDEQNALITAKCNEVLQATLKAHNTELVAAQRKYMQEHPAAR